MYPEERSAKSITVDDQNVTVDGFSFSRGPTLPAVRKESKFLEYSVEFYSNIGLENGLETGR